MLLQWASGYFDIWVGFTTMGITASLLQITYLRLEKRTSSKVHSMLKVCKQLNVWPL
jgi:hypothetical protein